MAKATAASTPPSADAVVPETPAVEQGWPNWRYVGPVERVYADIPVTVSTGDIVSWPENPGTDGNWEQTADPATRKPDNYRPTEG